MRLALLYPPPWKISRAGATVDSVDGPPPEYQPGDLDADFYQLPYGLMTLAASARQAGHQVKVLNLSSFEWSEVEDVIARLQADVYGMSCWTANRRGVALTAETIRRLAPQAHVVVGGPHATALAPELLSHHEAIDSVCEGEGEDTLLELLSRLAEGRSLQDIPGLWQRDSTNTARKPPPRAAIEPLDRLPDPHQHLCSHVVMTSRGCPWNCTFCGAETSWGRGFRGFSVPYVLEMLERTLKSVPVRMLLIKDDTFTTNRRRVLDICRGIRERKLSFLWSCDTRVDVLSDELLREMRLAGCERLSLGVESGSQEVLSRIDKKIRVDQILQATALAKKYGVKVRYYMMLGNRGETRDTFAESLRFLEEAKPHQYLFSCLSVYPGTRDFHDAEAAGWLHREMYFEGKFQELKIPFDATAEFLSWANEWFAANRGLHELYRPSAAECQQVADRLGGHGPALLDLAEALLREGRLDEAWAAGMAASDAGHPCPGLVCNLLACVAMERGDTEGMKTFLLQGARTDPQHPVLIRNAQAARQWLTAGGDGSGHRLSLLSDHSFSLLERTQQPALPGPLQASPEDWEAPNLSQSVSCVSATPKRLRVL
jgi:anaerobic magnesium-protoporphyrin IX monomethyl ester cyclase